MRAGVWISPLLKRVTNFACIPMELNMLDLVAGKRTYSVRGHIFTHTKYDSIRLTELRKYLDFFSASYIIIFKPCN